MVKLEGDPFAVRVEMSQLSCNQTGKSVSSPPQGNKARTRKDSQLSKTDAKQLRKDAQALGIEGYEDMSIKKLAKAVAKAEKKAAKSTPKKAVAKKAPAAKKPAAKKTAPKAKAAAKPKTDKPKGKPGPKPRVVEPGENPYRPGTAMHVAFGILKTGGTRRVMAQKLAKKAQIHPHSRAGNTTEADYDKRLILTSQHLQKNFGWGVSRDGRGLDGKLKIFPPGAAVPEAKGKKAPAAKPAAKKAPAKKVAAKKAPAKKAVAKKTPAKKAGAKRR